MTRSEAEFQPVDLPLFSPHWLFAWHAFICRYLFIELHTTCPIGVNGQWMDSCVILWQTPCQEIVPHSFPEPTGCLLKQRILNFEKLKPANVWHFLDKWLWTTNCQSMHRLMDRLFQAYCWSRVGGLNTFQSQKPNSLSATRRLVRSELVWILPVVTRRRYFLQRSCNVRNWMSANRNHNQVMWNVLSSNMWCTLSCSFLIYLLHDFNSNCCVWGKYFSLTFLAQLCPAGPGFELWSSGSEACSSCL